MSDIIKTLTVSWVFCLFSCETILTMQEVDPAAVGNPSGRIILATQVEPTSEGEVPCVITFKALTTNAVLSVTLATHGAPKVFLAPAAKYKFDRLRCAGRRQFELSDILPYQFTVTQDKTALVGSLSMKFDDQKSQVFMRLTDGRRVMHKEFQDVIRKSRQPVISAYTDKPVTQSMYALGGEGAWNVQLLYDPLAGPKGERPASPALDPIFECERREFEWNPLRLGALQVSITFENGVPKETLMNDSVYLFSDAFVECVKTTGKSFKVDAKGRSKLQLLFK